MQRDPSNILLALWIAVAAGGCVRAGRGLDEDIRVKLAPTVTNKSDVKTLFGAPQAASTVPLDDNGCIEHWSYVGDRTGRTSRLTVSFAPRGRVCSWSTVSSARAATGGHDEWQ